MVEKRRSPVHILPGCRSKQVKEGEGLGEIATMMKTLSFAAPVHWPLLCCRMCNVHTTHSYSTTTPLPLQMTFQDSPSPNRRNLLAALFLVFLSSATFHTVFNTKLFFKVEAKIKEVHSNPNMEVSTSILIIGAGPAGLALLHSLSSLPSSPNPPPSFTCFDRQPSPGGMWTGDRRFSPMYSGMWLNGQKKYTEFPSYTYDEHFGRKSPAFLPRSAITDYLSGFAEKHDLGRHVEGNRDVVAVEWDQEKKQFKVQSRAVSPVEQDPSTSPAITPYTSTSPGGGPIRTDHFTHVVVASGSFNSPRFSPFDAFAGEQTHSRSWAGPRGYEGKTVVVRGGGSSADDIAALLLKHGCGQVIQSSRSYGKGAPGEVEMAWANEKGFPDYRRCPGVTNAVGNTVEFELGCEPARNVDVLIHATGYEFSGSFSYLHESLRIDGNFNYPVPSVHDLHLNLFFYRNRNLVYLAQNNAIHTFEEYEAKAEYLAGIFSSRISLPTPEEIRSARSQQLSETDLDALYERLGEEAGPDETLCTVYVMFAMHFEREFLLAYAKAAGKSEDELASLKSKCDAEFDYCLTKEQDYYSSSCDKRDSALQQLTGWHDDPTDMKPPMCYVDYKTDEFEPWLGFAPRETTHVR